MLFQQINTGEIIIKEFGKFIKIENNFEILLESEEI